MKGLELAERYYFEIGRPILWQRFPTLMPRIAAGLAGEGSECFGYDDEYSRDHDFGPSFCLWMLEEDYAKWGAKVQKVYQALPGEFLGFPARQTTNQGQNRVGVLRIRDFYGKFTGCPAAPANEAQWLRIPEHFLAQVTNGKVFEDPSGAFSRIRDQYLAFYPTEVRWKKLAARAVTMAQAGQYNYPRSLKRQDDGAAFLALQEFVQAAISMVHLLNNRYTPYYKWMFRSFSELPFPAVQKEHLSAMIREPQNPRNTDRIEQFCGEIAAEWRRQGLTTLDGAYLEPLGWELYGRIQSDYLRQLHILTA